MPIYEYKCKGCEREFESLVLSPDEEIRCPECKGKTLEKLFSSFGVKSENSFSGSSVPVGSGCGCSPVGCGCGVKR